MIRNGNVGRYLDVGVKTDDYRRDSDVSKYLDDAAKEDVS